MQWSLDVRCGSAYVHLASSGTYHSYCHINRRHCKSPVHSLNGGSLLPVTIQFGFSCMELFHAVNRWSRSVSNLEQRPSDIEADSGMGWQEDSLQ